MTMKVSSIYDDVCAIDVEQILMNFMQAWGGWQIGKQMLSHNTFSPCRVDMEWRCWATICATDPDFYFAKGVDPL